MLTLLVKAVPEISPKTFKSILMNGILYLKYLKMKFSQFLCLNMQTIDLPVIKTTDQRMKIGEVYQFREGGYLVDVKLEEIRFEDHFFYVNLRVLEESNELIECSHKVAEGVVFTGMWALYDKDTYTIRQKNYRDGAQP